MTRAALAMLTDGRFPSGAHAYSAGIEVAVARREVVDLGDLERFLLGRAWTGGVVDASFAAWIAARRDSTVPWGRVDREMSARLASAAQRAASRRLGRQLARVAARVWPSAWLAALAATPGGPHHAVTLGATAASAGLDVEEAAFVAVLGALTGPANAALRLLGLDPVGLQALLAGLAGVIESVVVEAVAASGGPLDDLPCRVGPASELAAEEHLERSPRLFAS